MRLEFTHAGETVMLDAAAEGTGWRVTLPDGTTETFQARRLPDGNLLLTQGTRSFRVAVAQNGNETLLFRDGATYRFSKGAAKTGGAARAEAVGLLVAPMPGLVTKVLVAEGEAVSAYQPLATVEAMKVVATLEAPFAGTVRRVYVTAGTQVTQGAEVVEVAPLPAPETA